MVGVSLRTNSTSENYHCHQPLLLLHRFIVHYCVKKDVLSALIVLDKLAVVRPHKLAVVRRHKQVHSLILFYASLRAGSSIENGAQSK